MKKFIFILIAIMFVACKANAQTAKSKTLRDKDWYYEDANNVSLTGDTLTYTFKTNKADDVFYDIQINLDSVSGTPDYDVDLKGKVFADDAWTDLETDITWDGTSSDTTILFQEHSTAVFVRYIQLQVNGQSGSGNATADKIVLKIWP